MSYSTSLLLNTAPPASRMIKRLGLMLWLLPIFFSIACAGIASKSRKPGPQFAGKFQQRVAAADALAGLKPIGEPETFARVATTAFVSTPLNLPKSGEAKFPMQAELARHEPWSAGKIALKVDGVDSRLLVAKIREIPGDGGVRAIPKMTAALAEAPLKTLASFRRVRVLGPTAILADNQKILLKGVEGLSAGSNCRRLDGVLQSCIERAEHRLAILLQARSVTCRISEPAADGVHAGHCMADKIDIAADLLRNRLVQRYGITLASR